MFKTNLIDEIKKIRRRWTIEKIIGKITKNIIRVK